MIDLTNPLYTAASSYDARRSGTGSITRPNHLGQPFPRGYRRTYVHADAEPVAVLAKRVYGFAKAVSCPIVARKPAHAIRKNPARLKRRLLEAMVAIQKSGTLIEVFM